MAFRLIFPRSPCAEAAMRTVASSAALRVAEFGTQDHVGFLMFSPSDSAPFGAPSIN